jgi:hypothetical protein
MKIASCHSRLQENIYLYHDRLNRCLSIMNMHWLVFTTYLLLLFIEATNAKGSNYDMIAVKIQLN